MRAIKKSGFGQVRYLETNSGQTSFTLAAGRKTTALTLPLRYLAVPAGASGCLITFFGTGADDDTFSARLWKVARSQPVALARPDVIPDRDFQYIGGAVVTLSTAVGAAAADVPILSSERIGDAIVWTAGAMATLLDASASLGTIGVASVTANTPAVLYVPYLGGADEIVIEFDLTGTSTGANAVVEFLP
jgi:hypothetical protein